MYKPASRHENSSLECSRDGKPSNVPGPAESLAGSSSRCGFSFRNSVQFKSDRESSLSFGVAWGSFGQLRFQFLFSLFLTFILMLPFSLQIINFGDLRDFTDTRRHLSGFMVGLYSCNGRNSQEFIQERIDRFVGCQNWVQMFPFATVRHLDFWGSDHRPIIIDFCCAGDSSFSGPKKRGRRFHFEEFWAESEDCGELIDQHWQHSAGNTSMDNICASICRCATSLHAWSMKTFKNFSHRLALKKKELHDLNSHVNSSSWKRVREVEKELEALLYKEERYWHQRSRVSYLRSGDRNTRYFHSKATGRQRQNHIEGLLDRDNMWQTNHDQVAMIVQDYFQDLFASLRPTENDYSAILQAVHCKVSPNMNQYHDFKFLAYEVRRAVFDMHPTKSPGKDGMLAFFYQRY
ncbi:hypothetical protein ACOSP7_004578 [Xanthoceras sorbifolium]